MAAEQRPSLEQAYQILRVNIAKLINELQPEDICDGLLAAGIVDNDQYKFATDEKKNPKSRVRKLLFPTLQSVNSKYEHFETFCTILEESDSSVANEWAKKLKDDLEKMHQSQRQLNGKELNSHVKTLKEELTVLRRRIFESDDNLDIKYDIVKEFITTFIENSLDCSPENEVRDQLHKLCYEEMLIPAKLYSWTFEKLEELSQPKVDVSASELPHSKEKITNRDLSAHEVHNCLLLCKMVSQCNYTTYIEFLSKTDHQFDEVSFSNSPPKHLKNDLKPYAIAKNESKKEIYVAFLGEPDICVWKDNCATFEEGLRKQTSRIPVRFFIEQIQDGYSIIFTGFSFGALLALSVYVSVWNQTCLSQNDLVKYVACITFGLPLIPLEDFDKTVSSIPRMKENSHFFLMKDDLIPRLLQYSELKDGNSEKFLGKFGVVIVNKLIEFWKRHYSVTKTGKKIKTKEGMDILELRSILQEKTTGMQKTNVYGTCHLVYPDSSDTSYNVSQLTPTAALEVLKVPNAEELDHFNNPQDLIVGHSFSHYENVLSKVYPDDDSGNIKLNKTVLRMSSLKPIVLSVKFYRHGDEIALVLEGENLWFCCNIKITSTKSNSSRNITALEVDGTCHSIDLHYTPRFENDLLIQRGKLESVDVVLYSHFAGPVNKKSVPAECISEYHISYRQRQLAKCTPAEIIQLSFLSALLECMSNDCASHRYKTVCQFLEDAVRIVPIESIFFAIAYGTDVNSWKCAETFVSSDITISPSFISVLSLTLACKRLIFGVNPDVLADLESRAIYSNIMMQLQDSLSFPILPPLVDIAGEGDTITVSARALEDACAFDTRTFSEVVQGKEYVSTVKYKRESHSHPVNSDTIITEFRKLRDKSIHLSLQQASRGIVHVISNANIQQLYPAKIKKVKISACNLQSPISVLKSGRQALNQLQKNANEEVFQFLAEGEDPRVSHNEEMISVIDNIVNNDLAICVSMLGGFMEQSIQIPLVDDSPSYTAEILQTTEAPPAVGVWALFSLNMIDFQKMLRNKKGKALYVKVEKYIKSILSKSSLPEELYAGKLQFLMQCLDSSARCSDEYISYSLEVQLAKLCEHRNIKPSTTITELTKQWSHFFKGNILCHVYDEFHPLIARWIIWCLNIHHLREELSSHTTVGIIGLGNSGKSYLVKTLFKLKVLAGTTNMQRTTIPFLYNLEGTIDGLNVIDFPGVDDKDSCVVAISKILLQISQLVVLVMEYKRCNTEAANKLVEVLRKTGVPVLICLTHADKLYASTCINENGERLSNDNARRILSKELEENIKTLSPGPNWKVELYSFCQDSDSTLNDDEGRKTLADVGISSCADVGKWIEKELRDYMNQEKLADRLKKFMFPEISTPVKRKRNSAVPVINGLQVIAETRFVIFQEGTTLTWEKYGLKITVPPDSISENTLPVYIKVISSGEYKLPDDSVLVSSLYWLYCPKKFLKYVTVEIQHCSHTKENLAFIHGRCDQELPYLFKTQQGLFSEGEMGSIYLNSFCLLGIISWLFPNDKPEITSQKKSHRPFYVAKVFVKSSNTKNYKFELVFTKALSSFHSRINKRYEGEGWMLDFQETFELHNTCQNILVEVRDQPKLQGSGWKYTMKNSGNIGRNLLESCEPDSAPCCCLEFQWTKDTDPVPVECTLLIKNVVGQPLLTLTLPTNCSFTASQPDHMQENGYQSLSACTAVKLLRRANFSFSKYFSSLLTELGIDTETKRILWQKVQRYDGDYLMPTEEAIDWWIKNKPSSLQAFIEIVRKCESNTADKIWRYVNEDTF